ncbi:hypothetical protein F4859DRAFT_1791 [Xylaria cf. heliscus]|nr:hypothetical protein F4859DRAFT_1791 [Xylaria cf. heliscus]
MNGDSGNNNAQGSPGSRRPSSGSSISSLNPEAAAFNYRQPESPRYPVGPSNHNRGVRGNSRGQPGTFPLPHIPPRPGRQGHHQQPPPMMQGGGGSAPFQSTPIFGPGPGYQPMFPTSQAPQVPIFCGLPPMPPPGYPQQYPGHGGEHPSSHQDVSSRL